MTSILNMLDKLHKFTHIYNDKDFRVTFYFIATLKTLELIKEIETFPSMRTGNGGLIYVK